MKILSLDLDHTIIKPKGKTKFPKSPSDWRLMYDNTLLKLREYQDKGYVLSIFTNPRKETTIRVEQHKQIREIFNNTGLNIRFYVAWKDGGVKPGMGMWNTFMKDLNNPDIDMENSIYVGDAAGRENDYSSCDRAFAKNIGLPFQTPEQFFSGINEDVPFTWKGCITQEQLVKTNNINFIPETKQTMLVCCGPPASGKSTFSKGLPDNFKRFSLDEMSKAKAKKAIKKTYADGFSIVVDSTNPTEQHRKEWFDLVSDDIPKKVVYFITPRINCEYSNQLRIKPIPKLVYNIFFKKLEEPTGDKVITQSYTPKFVIIV